MGLFSKLLRSSESPSGQRSRRVRPDRRDPVRVHIVGPNSLDILNARDISETGLSVYVPHRFEGCDIESEVELVITLPAERAFKARGVVRHHTQDDDRSAFFGVQSTQIDEGPSRLIRSYVTARLPD